jgi:hypothetical protein
MQDPKAVQFFEGVLAKTRDGKIRWEPTAEESDYMAAIGGKFTLLISKGEVVNRWPSETYSLVLKDQDGRELIRVADYDDGIARAEISELYEAARRQALHVDEKIDSVLGELSKL